MSGLVQTRRQQRRMLASTAPRPSARLRAAVKPRSRAAVRRKAQGLRAARLAALNWRGPLSHFDRTLSERSSADFYRQGGRERSNGWEPVSWFSAPPEATPHIGPRASRARLGRKEG